MNSSTSKSLRRISLAIVISLYFCFGYFESKHYIFDISEFKVIPFSRPEAIEYIYDTSEIFNQVKTYPRWSHQLLVSFIFGLLAVTLVHLWFNNKTFTKITVLLYCCLALIMISIFLLGIGLESHKLAYGAPRALKNTFLASPFLPFFLVAVGSLFKLTKS